MDEHKNQNKQKQQASTRGTGSTKETHIPTTKQQGKQIIKDKGT